MILERANEAIARGDYEAFLAFCSEDTLWTFVGETVLRGKQAVRKYMAEVYVEPPKFIVENMIAEGEFVTALGRICIRDEDGHMVDNAYCDVWRFQNGKMAELKAFVIKASCMHTV